MKRFFILICVFALLGAANLFASGASAGTSSGERPVLDISIIQVISKDRVPSERPTLYEDEMLKNWGIKLEYEDYVEDAYTDRITVLMASDEHPKMLGPGPRTWDVNPWGLEGYIRAMEDHLDKVPNFKRQWETDEWDFMVTKSTAADGHLYMLPNKNPRKASMTWIYRKSDFDKYGLEFPTTTDEMYEMLKAYKAAKPSFIGITNRAGANGPWQRMIHSFRTSPSFFKDYDRTTAELTYGPSTDKFRDMMTFVRKLYVEGLLDPEFPTRNYQTWTEQVARGEAGFLFSWGTRAPWSEGVETDPDAEWAYALSPIAAYPEKGALGQLEEAYFPWGNIFTDKMNDEELDRMLEYLDWTATDEGWIWTKYGVEGVTMQFEGKMPVYMDHMYDVEKNPDGRAMWSYGFALALANYWTPSWLPKSAGDQTNDIISEYVGTLEPLRGYDQHGQPWQNLVMNFTEEESKDYADIEVVVNQVRDEWALKFSLGQLDPQNDASWADFQKALKGAGLDEMASIANKVYKRTPYNMQ